MREGFDAEALREMREIGDWIRENLGNKGFMDRYGHVVERFEKITSGMKLILEREELTAMKNQSREHRYPWNLFYDDLRRSLFKISL